MSASVDNERTLLLILPKKKEIYPLSTAALKRAQASKRSLKNDYQEALIIDRDGILRRIDYVEVLGPWGDSVGRKLLSRLTDAWHIVVHLSEPLSWQLEKLKELLAEIISTSGNMEFPELAETSSRQEAVRAILAASTVDQIFDILKMPSPENALDVL